MPGEVAGERVCARDLRGDADASVSEALTNAVKHSGAKRVEVRAQVDDGVLRVEIRDDGAGGARLEGSTGLTGSMIALRRSMDGSRSRARRAKAR